MASTTCGNPVIILLLLCFFLTGPVVAYGAGAVSSTSSLKGYVAKHGDIEDVILTVMLEIAQNSPMNKLKFTAKDKKLIYFGNWLRDFSQIVDAATLAHVPESFLRIIVAVISKLAFGYSTREWEVTKDRLGVYRPEEHIDNPRGYPPNAQKYDRRCRGPVQQIELDIDPHTGMKNYIANEDVGITTSIAYVREQLLFAIDYGRQIETRDRGMRHLGAALHCLEDFAAHTNYVELSLLMLAKEEGHLLHSVFPGVGEAAVIETARGPAPPLVTGTFGPLDFFDTILGEASDRAAAGDLGELGYLDNRLGTSDSEGDSGLADLIANKDVPDAGKSKLKLLKDQLTQSLKSGTETQAFQAVLEAPEKLWQQIEPIFRVHDDVKRFFEELEIVPELLLAVLAGISNAIDKVLFTMISPLLKPLVTHIRTFLEQQRRYTEALALQSAHDSDVDVFAPGSTATNPTHTLLAKDHFDSVLNNPSSQIAALITRHAAFGVMKCWLSSTLDSMQVVNHILHVFHHPFNRDPEKQLQRLMYEVVRKWWVIKSPEAKAAVLPLLTKEAIMQGQNKHLMGQWMDPSLETLFPEYPRLNNPFIEQIMQRLRDLSGAGKIPGPTPDFDQIYEKLQKAADASDPNPFDSAMSRIMAPVKEVFVGINPVALTGISTMGDTMKQPLMELMLRAQALTPEGSAGQELDDDMVMRETSRLSGDVKVQ